MMTTVVSVMILAAFSSVLKTSEKFLKPTASKVESSYTATVTGTLVLPGAIVIGVEITS